jgi:hypothetical protein
MERKVEMNTQALKGWWPLYVRVKKEMPLSPAEQATYVAGDAVYKEWWKLHIRNASQEPLSVEERREYEQGMSYLEAEKDLRVDVAGILRTKREIARLERERAELQALCDRQAAEIRGLEKTLGIRAEELLAMEI